MLMEARIFLAIRVHRHLILLERVQLLPDRHLPGVMLWRRRITLAFSLLESPIHGLSPSREYSSALNVSATSTYSSKLKSSSLIETFRSQTARCAWPAARTRWRAAISAEH